MIELNNSTPKKQLDSYLVQTVQELMNCNRCIVVTGAGISCSAGIPDFRSADGLYNMVKESFPKTFTKGADLFDATLFKNEEATSYFYKFMGQLKYQVQQSSHTVTHKFIKLLVDKGKLLRCYTQNIDDLEGDLNLNRDLNDTSSVQVVQLHGTLSRVVCTLSNQHNFEFDSKHIEYFKEGKVPACPSCETYEQERVKSGKRAPATGHLRPDIVLYNEIHPQGEQIGKVQCNDLRKKPDLLIIMGTSLKVIGCKRLVKEMAKSIHANKKGKVIFVNLGTVSESEWGDVIDYHFKLHTDNWVDKIMNVWSELDQNTPKNLLMGSKAISTVSTKEPKKNSVKRSQTALRAKSKVRVKMSKVSKPIKTARISPTLIQSPLKFPSIKPPTTNILQKSPAFKEFNNKLSKGTGSRSIRSLSFPTFSPKKTRSYYVKQAKLQTSGLGVFLSPSKRASVVSSI